jgi:hypothetical protein
MSSTFSQTSLWYLLRVNGIFIFVASAAHGLLKASHYYSVGLFCLLLAVQVCTSLYNFSLPHSRDTGNLSLVHITFSIHYLYEVLDLFYLQRLSQSCVGFITRAMLSLSCSRIFLSSLDFLLPPRLMPASSLSLFCFLFHSLSLALLL